MPSKTPRKPDSPTLWIVAGPNGSGKSTFYNRTDIEGWGGSIWIINPDLLTQQIVEREKAPMAAANAAALDRIMTWLDASIDAYQTIGVETVLSSAKYQPLVERARARGFRVHMIYILLNSAELQVERVRVRVAEGGHDVPAEKIIARRRRSFEQLAWFSQHIDLGYVFDNSTAEPKLVAHMLPGMFVRWNDLPNDLEEVLAGQGVHLIDRQARPME